MSNSFKIIIIDDEPAIADSIQLVLREEGYEVHSSPTARLGEQSIRETSFDLALIDLQLPDRDGLDLLIDVKRVSPKTEVIIITGYGTIDTAVAATKAGAFDFVEKPFEPEVLLSRVKRALEKRQLVRENEQMRQQLSQPEAYFDIVGHSKPMQDLFDVIESVAKSTANILIVGESGTGKELIANAIHYNSERATKQFVKVNCAALPRELMESELFGHTKGAFTGATSDKTGLIGQAKAGSLLLDEIGEMPIELQPKLLRVLQERVYRRLGSSQDVEVDFRLICSTNRNPQQAIRDGLLRDDLFYRISTITIEVPPLRDRREDVQLLADHYVKFFAGKYSKSVVGIEQDAYQRLFDYNWPGNVRELSNMIERAVLLSKSDLISVNNLPFQTAREEVVVVQQNDEFHCPITLKLEEIEKLAILQALRHTNGNKHAASELLGVYRPRLYAKIQKHNLTEYL